MQDRIAAMSLGNDPVMQSVLEGTRVEMDLFREHGDAYGYTFYVLRKA